MHTLPRPPSRPLSLRCSRNSGRTRPSTTPPLYTSRWSIARNRRRNLKINPRRLGLAMRRRDLSCPPICHCLPSKPGRPLRRASVDPQRHRRTRGNSRLSQVCRLLPISCPFLRTSPLRHTLRLPSRWTHQDCQLWIAGTGRRRSELFRGAAEVSHVETQPPSELTWEDGSRKKKSLPIPMIRRDRQSYPPGPTRSPLTAPARSPPGIGEERESRPSDRPSIRRVRREKRLPSLHDLVATRTESSTRLHLPSLPLLSISLVHSHLPASHNPCEHYK
jgi:hypothetical protein